MTSRSIVLVLLGVASAACDRSEGPGDDTGAADAEERPSVGSNAQDDTDPQDTAPPDTGSDTDTQPVADEACYLGADEDGTECLPLVSPANPGSAYDYPAPLQGSANYREPVAWLDLQALDGATLLAPNFRLDEFAQVEKGRYAVVQPHLIEAVQGIRDDLGAIIVNSGYRSPGYNDGIDGSATYSRHMYGDAADLDPVSASLSTLKQACEDAGAGYVGVYTTHMHCDWRDDPVDEAFFGPAGRARGTWADLPRHDAWIARDGDVLVAPAEGWDEGEPLREWYAYDADGVLIEVVTAPDYEPPIAADEVVVVVGRAVTRHAHLGEL